MEITDPTVKYDFGCGFPRREVLEKSVLGPFLGNDYLKDHCKGGYADRSLGLNATRKSW